MLKLDLDWKGRCLVCMVSMCHVLACGLHVQGHSWIPLELHWDLEIRVALIFLHVEVETAVSWPLFLGRGASSKV